VNWTLNMSDSQSHQSPMDLNRCVGCKGFADDSSESGLVCNGCHQWQHVKCAGWTDEAYKTIRPQPGFRFFCAQCLPGVDHLLPPTNQEIHADRFTQLELRVGRLEKSMISGRFIGSLVSSLSIVSSFHLPKNMSSPAKISMRCVYCVYLDML